MTARWVVGELEFDAKSRGRNVQNHKLEFDANLPQKAADATFIYTTHPDVELCEYGRVV